MRGLEHLRNLVDPPVDQDPADQLARVAKSMVGAAATVTRGSATEAATPMPLRREIVAKVRSEHANQAVTVMLGAGARRVGKQLVLGLGNARVTYARGEFVGKSEQGRVEAVGADAEDVLMRIGLSDLLDTVESDG